MLELLFAPHLSYSCDFDVISLLDDGSLYWEHEEYYPEYLQAIEWEASYPENMNYHYNRPPEWFDGIMPDDHPIYGRDVNSLCWQQHFCCLSHFIETGFDLLPERIDSGCVRINEKISEKFDLECYCNTKYRLYAPKQSYPSKIKIKAPDGYKHWLTFGREEALPELFIFYPLRAKGRISVLLQHTNGMSSFINWHHGVRGLLSAIHDEIEKTYINYTMRTETFFEKWLEIINQR